MVLFKNTFKSISSLLGKTLPKGVYIFTRYQKEEFIKKDEAQENTQTKLRD